MDLLPLVLNMAANAFVVFEGFSFVFLRLNLILGSFFIDRLGNTYGFYGRSLNGCTFACSAYKETTFNSVDYYCGGNHENTIYERRCYNYFNSTYESITFFAYLAYFEFKMGK
jgi:hypothetical protein